MDSVCEREISVLPFVCALPTFFLAVCANLFCVGSIFKVMSCVVTTLEEFLQGPLQSGTGVVLVVCVKLNPHKQKHKILYTSSTSHVV